MQNISSKYLILFLLFLSACAFSSRIPIPVDDRASILGVRVHIKGPSLGSHVPTSVFFMRVDNPNAHPRTGEAIKANYHNDDVFYLLNAPPGDYMLAYCLVPVSGNRVTFLFPEKVALSSRTRLKSAETAFMGNITLTTTTKQERSDSFQTFLVTSLGLEQTTVSDAVRKPFIPFAIKPNQIIWYGIPGNIIKSDVAYKKFLANSRKTFKRTAWSSRF